MTVGFLGAMLDRAKRRPDDIAFTLLAGAGGILTNAALASQAKRWSSFLISRGAGAGDVVLIALPLSTDLLCAFLGATLAGCVPSFMPCPSVKQDPELFWSSHDALFSRLGGGVIVTSRANGGMIAERVTGAAMIVVAAEDFANAIFAPSPELGPRRASEQACLQHSSGTTGLKKGVMLTFAKIEAQIDAYLTVLDIGADSTVVSWLPLYHDMGFVACFLLPLTVGARVVMLDPFEWVADPLALFEAIETYRGRFVWLPNFAFNHLVNAAEDDERRFDLSSVRAFVDCSEPCVARSLASFEARFRSWGLGEGRALTCYAMAETVFAVTQSPPGRPATVVTLDKAELDRGVIALVKGPADGGAALVSSGAPLPGVELATLDEEKRSLPPGSLGQIAVRAPFLFDGYHLQPERAASVFHEGFFLTGDVGFVWEGELFVLGRRDDVVVLSGRNIFASEVEDVVSGVPGIRPGRVFAFGLYDDAIGTRELVVVAEIDGGVAEADPLRKAVRTRLNDRLGLVPRKVRFARNGWIVKSTSGKISRGENLRKFQASLDAKGEFANE